MRKDWYYYYYCRIEKYIYLTSSDAHTVVYHICTQTSKRELDPSRASLESYVNFHRSVSP